MADRRLSPFHLDEEELSDDAKGAVEEIATKLPSYRWEGRDPVLVASRDFMHSLKEQGITNWRLL